MLKDTLEDAMIVAWVLLLPLCTFELLVVWILAENYILVAADVVLLLIVTKALMDELG